MFGRYFYHEITKKSVGTFGALFNDIYVVRKGPNNTSENQVKVPLSYAPKRKYLESLRKRLKEQNEEDKIAIRLPRMSFEIVAINYDPQRQLPKTQYCNVAGSNGLTRKKVYTQTPYTISFQLSIYAKTQDDILQVVEQIVPYFTPSYTLTISPIDDYPDIKLDVPLSLQAVSFTDNYEGNMDERREIVWTLDFEMQTAYYGDTGTESKVIKEADIKVFLDDSDSGWTQYERINVAVDPRDATIDSDYSIIETITFLVDSGGYSTPTNPNGIWIMQNGVWQDSGIWQDSATWIDSGA